MKISFMSDFHLGYRFGKELDNDSFENAKEAIDKSAGSDLIVIGGDTFDTRIPKIGVWSRFFEIFSGLPNKKSKLELIRKIGKHSGDSIKKKIEGIPIIALHGNHERRGKGQTNIIKALEKSGLLTYLHLNGLVFKKGKQKVAIQGMSAVPERYAKKILDKWNPEPIEGCYNILLIHQNVEPFIYSPLDPPTLNLENIPQNFDLVVNGHIHTKNMAKLGNESKFIITGSTVVTQLKEEESKIPKGFYKLSLPEKKLDFVELENTRKFIFKEVKLSDELTLRDQVSEKVKEVLNSKFDKKPILKFKLTGKNSDLIEKDLREIKKLFQDVIIKFSKKLESDDSTEESNIIDKIKDGKLSLEEIGMELLKENLVEIGFKKSFDHEVVFKLLSSNQTKNAYNIILKKQTSLKSFGENK